MKKKHSRRYDKDTALMKMRNKRRKKETRSQDKHRRFTHARSTEAISHCQHDMITKEMI